MDLVRPGDARVDGHLDRVGTGALLHVERAAGAGGHRPTRGERDQDGGEQDRHPEDGGLGRAGGLERPHLGPGVRAAETAWRPPPVAEPEGERHEEESDFRQDDPAVRRPHQRVRRLHLADRRDGARGDDDRDREQRHPGEPDDHLAHERGPQLPGPPRVGQRAPAGGGQQHERDQATGPHGGGQQVSGDQDHRQRRVRVGSGVTVHRHRGGEPHRAHGADELPPARRDAEQPGPAGERDHRRGAERDEGHLDQPALAESGAQQIAQDGRPQRREERLPRDGRRLEDQDQHGRHRQHAPRRREKHREPATERDGRALGRARRPFLRRSPLRRGRPQRWRPHPRASAHRPDEQHEGGEPGEPHQPEQPDERLLRPRRPVHGQRRDGRRGADVEGEEAVRRVAVGRHHLPEQAVGAVLDWPHREVDLPAAVGQPERARSDELVVRVDQADGAELHLDRLRVVEADDGRGRLQRGVARRLGPEQQRVGVRRRGGGNHERSRHRAGDGQHAAEPGRTVTEQRRTTRRTGDRTNVCQRWCETSAPSDDSLAARSS